MGAYAIGLIAAIAASKHNLRIVFFTVMKPPTATDVSRGNGAKERKCASSIDCGELGYDFHRKLCLIGKSLVRHWLVLHPNFWNKFS